MVRGSYDFITVAVRSVYVLLHDFCFIVFPNGKGTFVIGL